MIRGDLLTPWREWRWGFGAVWLVFLIFPFADVFRSDQLSVGARIAGGVLLVAFAAIYIAACVYIFKPAFDGQRRTRIGTWLFIALVVVAIALIPIIRGAPLYLGTYFMAIACFQFPLAVAVIFVAAFVVASVVIPDVVPGIDDDSGLTIVMIVVGMSLMLVRLLNNHEAAQRKVRMQQRESNEQLAIVAERERVARDVHDILGHSLTVMTVKSELAGRLVDIDPERAKAELAELHTMSRVALSEVRATVSGLRTPELETELASAETALRAASVSLAVTGRDEIPQMSMPNRTLFAWVVREAVTNVVRHSSAQSASIAIGRQRICVSDNGCGFDSRIGNGLRGLTERVETSGGALTIASTSTGTTLAVDVDE